MSQLMSSFHRSRSRGLVEKFYNLFLDADPRIRLLFKNTDFAGLRELLLHAIFVLLEYSEGKAVGELAIRRLGEVHRARKEITPDMYPLWMDCLMKALVETDPEFSPVLEKEWRRALQKGIDVMLGLH